MDIPTIEKWLLDSHNVASKAAAAWWPSTQAEATSWATEFMLAAALDLCSNTKLTIHTTSGKGGTTATSVSAFCLTNKNFKMHTGTLMVDFSIHDSSAADPIQLTAESETGVAHETGSNYLDKRNDYAWDFFKLLIVPSRNRLFYARVSDRKKSTTYIRCKQLAMSLVALYNKHAPAFVRPNDRLAIAIVPSKYVDRDKGWLVSVVNGVVTVKQCKNTY